MNKGVQLTWLGHATMLFETPEGKRVLVDPWLANNPKCPAEWHSVRSDAILLTHGHFDHVGDVGPAAGACSGKIVGIFELVTWLRSKGIAPEDQFIDMNMGGTIELESLDLRVTMTDAKHSSSGEDGLGLPYYLGEPAGFVLSFENEQTIYIAGDTALFGDMEWIGRLYEPDTAILPIGGHYTMGPREAAQACALLGVSTVIPYHYGTFPILAGTPAELREHLQQAAPEVQVLELEPGKTVSLN